MLFYKSLENFSGEEPPGTPHAVTPLILVSNDSNILVIL